MSYFVFSLISEGDVLMCSLVIEVLPGPHVHSGSFLEDFRLLVVSSLQWQVFHIFRVCEQPSTGDVVLPKALELFCFFFSLTFMASLEGTHR